jgi:two-component system OmpR family response regulator
MIAQESQDVHLILIVDAHSHSILVGNRVMHTTPSEYEILAFMAARRGRLVTRETLADVLYGAKPDCDAPLSNVIDVMISHIRRKLSEAGASPLQRRWGAGYILP